RAQTHISERLDSEHTELATKLVLTQEFYKQKFTVHADFDKQLTNLTDDLHDAQLDKQRKSGGQRSRNAATDDIAGLSEFMRKNGFYLSQQVREDVQRVWILAGASPVVNTAGTSTMAEINAAVAEAQKAMQDEATGAMAEISK